jgi:glucose/arabinose dehydrogenase
MTAPRRSPAVRRTFVPLVASAALVGSLATMPASTASPTGSPAVQGRSTVAGNLDVPWDLAFLPGGRALLTQRDRGSVVMVRKNGSKKVVARVKGVASDGDQGGESGLLGIAVHPRFKRTKLVYLYMSTASDNRIVRMKWRQGRLTGKRPVLTGIPRGFHHNGGHLGFGPDGMLYASTGEVGNESLAQDRRSLGGKILRMRPNGRPAPGNPFGSRVWSYGHRNVQGFDWDRKGRLWAVEFGDKRADELNLIRKGGNYGWPVVEGRSSDRRFINPKMTWDNEIAGPSSIAIRGSSAWISGLTGHRVWRVTLKGRTATKRKDFWNGQYGRIRRTAVHGGALYFTTSNTDGRGVPASNDDRLVRVTFR